MSERKEFDVSLALALISEGKTLSQVANACGVSRVTVWRHLRETPELSAAYDLARRVSAEALVEQGAQILEEAAIKEGLTAAHAQIARSRSEYVRWLASKRSEEYADAKAQVNVNLSFGDAFLAALQQAGHREEIGTVVEAQLLPAANEDEDEAIEVEEEE